MWGREAVQHALAAVLSAREQAVGVLFLLLVCQVVLHDLVLGRSQTHFELDQNASEHERHQATCWVGVCVCVEHSDTMHGCAYQ